MAIQIKADGTITEIEVSTLKDLQQGVGGMIEYVGNVEYQGETLQMLADEEGLFKDNTINMWVIENTPYQVVGTVLLCNDVEFN